MARRTSCNLFPARPISYLIHSGRGLCLFGGHVASRWTLERVQKSTNVLFKIVIFHRRSQTTPKSFLDAVEIALDSLRDAHLVPPCRAERPMNHAQVAQTRILLILGEYLVYLEAIWHVFGHQNGCKSTNVSSSAAISSYICLPSRA